MQIASPAKINLFLEVLGKLDTGYHEIDTVLCSINLFDYLIISLTKTRGIKFWCNVPELMSESNLVVKVSNYVIDNYDIEFGLDIKLWKNIPVAAGLGGGSSNAAITLMVLNRLLSLQIDKARLIGIASEFGSDTPFFLLGGWAQAKGRGEILGSCPEHSLSNILLVNPGIQISSSEAYQSVKIPTSSELKRYNRKSPTNSIFNRLEKGIRSRYQKVDELLHKLNEMGAERVAMSGSGSTCFGIYPDQGSLLSSQEYFTGLGYWTHNASVLKKEEYWKSVFKA